MSKLKIGKNPCSRCLFGPSKIVDDERRDEIVEHCLRNDTHFSCHKGTLVEEDVVCHGFMENFPGVGQLLRIMGRCDGLEEVNHNKLTED